MLLERITDVDMSVIEVLKQTSEKWSPMDFAFVDSLAKQGSYCTMWCKFYKCSRTGLTSALIDNAADVLDMDITLPPESAVVDKMSQMLADVLRPMRLQQLHTEGNMAMPGQQLDQQPHGQAEQIGPATTAAPVPASEPTSTTPHGSSQRPVSAIPSELSIKELRLAWAKEFETPPPQVVELYVLQLTAYLHERFLSPHKKYPATIDTFAVHRASGGEPGMTVPATADMGLDEVRFSKKTSIASCIDFLHGWCSTSAAP